jgi:hypothetical protein
MITADEQIEAALRDGLSTDKSGINSDPVYRGLESVSRARYDKMWDFWIAYVDNITELSLESKLTGLRYPIQLRGTILSVVGRRRPKGCH